MASKRIKGITIELDANARPLTEAIKKAEKEIGDAAYKLRDVNKLLKMDPKNVELLTQKQKALTDAIEGTKDKLKQEREALEQLKNGPQTEQTIKQQEALSREIVETEQKLKSLEKEYKDFGSVAKQQTKAAAEEMQAAGKTIESAGRTMTSVGRGMTTYVTAPIVAAGTASVAYAANFEEAMDKVQAISGATREEMEKLEEISLKLGAETKFSATEMAEALSYMGMAGWSAEEMLAGLPGIASLAAAANEDLATTSDIVTDALTAFGYTAGDAARFSDILASAATNSNTTVSMLGESFKYAAAPAGTLSYTAEDVALALGLMANNGIKADMAGTSLRNIFQKMAKPTKESQAAIDMLGLSLYDAQGQMYSFRDVMYQMRNGFGEVKMSAEDFDKAIDDLDSALEAGDITQKKYDAELEELTRRAFGAEQAEKARAAAMLGGTRAMSGLLAIVNTSDEEFVELANAIDNSSQQFAKLADGSVVPLNEALESGKEIVAQYNGQAEAMAGIMEDNLNGDMRKMKASIEALGISMGKLLIPEIRSLVDSLKEFIDKINAMDEGSKKTIITVGKVLAVIGPLLMILGGIVTAIGKTVWAIGTIKGALAAGGVLSGLGASLSAAWATVTGAATSAASAVSGALGAIAAALGVTVGVLLGAIAAVVAAIVVWIKNWDAIKEAAGLFCERTIEHFQQLKDFLIGVFNNVKEAAGLFVERTVEHFNNLKAKAAEIWESIKTAIVERVETAVANVKLIFEGLGIFFGNLVKSASQWGSDLITSIKDGIMSGINKVKDAAKAVADAIRERLHFSEPDVGPLSDFNSWMPDMMKQMAEQINAGIPGVETAIQGTASAIKNGITAPDYSGQLTNISNGIGRLAAAGGDIVIPVNIGQQRLDNIVVSASQRHNYRNGGR